MVKKILLSLVLLLITTQHSLADEAYNSYSNTSCQDADEIAGFRSGTGMLNYTCDSLADYVIAEAAADSVVFNTVSLAADTNQIILDSNGSNTGTITMSTLTSSRSWTFPNSSGTIVIAGSTNTLSNKTLDETNKFGITLTAAAGNNFTLMEVGYLNSSGQVVEADADTVATSAGMLVLATGTINASASGVFVPLGFQTTSGLTAGATYYLSSTTGGITTTKPSSPGTVARVVGYAVSSTIFYFNPDQTYVEN